MAFDVQLARQVAEFIDASDRLTANDCARILEGIAQELGESADRFHARNPHPLAPDLFWYDYGLMTEAREWREFRFWCSAEGAGFGVIQVLYPEEFRDEAD